ncbi:MAG TPA: alginate export family protein [Candidatus Aminicenantes bacterium]|nr:alginate export family protein [Candidatus Aminicenantes bacterium]HRY64671.1 alginate export family protein [Candidatus Aminicenantes bacterium]HRZ71584.1 alginate export family protein [Candidatus Aminicenantes bacterium]
MSRRPLDFTIAATLLAALLISVPARPQDKPAPRLKLIFVERFRFEAWDNAVSLNDAAADGFAYTRNRTTLGLDWRAAGNLEVLGKVTNEFRVYLAPKDRAFNGHEVFFDNLYVKWTIPGRTPLTVTAGRQDLNFGEGFVIADGTPGDGSRSYYFNAVRLDADLAPGHRLTAFAHATKATDRFLPVINSRQQSLAEQPENALALYYAGTFGRAKLDAYAVRKTTDANEAWPVPARTDTLGARAVMPLAKPLSFTAEAAFQTGRYGDAGRSAYGAIAHLDYDLAGTRPLLKAFTLGGILLSGDDPATARMEGWDPVFSRWPKWSESYIYTLTRESRPSYWSNLSALYAQLAFDLGPRSDGHLMVMPMGAGRSRTGEFPGGTGLYRGTLYRARLNYKVSKFMTGRVIWEHLEPGSFYFPGAASFNWLQFELIFRY